MFDFIKSIFNKEKINYLEHDIVDSRDFAEITLIPIPDNEKKNILIMDDSEENAEITYDDFMYLFDISEKLSKGLNTLNKEEREFISKLNTKELTTLSSLNDDHYNVIVSSGEMAAFDVHNSINAGLHIDYAVLDIIIGGINLIDGRSKVLDGIDVAKKILDDGGKVNFYSGCSIDYDSSESVKSRNILNKNIKEMIIEKDDSFMNKKVKLIKLFNDK